MSKWSRTYVFLPVRGNASKQSPVRAFSAGMSILIIQAFLKLTTKSVLGALLFLFDRANHLQSNQDFILGTRGRPHRGMPFYLRPFPGTATRLSHLWESRILRNNRNVAISA